MAKKENKWAIVHIKNRDRSDYINFTNLEVNYPLPIEV